MDMEELFKAYNSLQHFKEALTFEIEKEEELLDSMARDSSARLDVLREVQKLLDESEESQGFVRYA